MEAYTSIGLSLPLAQERADQTLRSDEPGVGAAPVVDVVVPSPAQNDQALAALEAMMGGARPK